MARAYGYAGHWVNNGYSSELVDLLDPAERQCLTAGRLEDISIGIECLLTDDDAVAAETEHEVETQRAELEAREDAEILAELNLPDPDDLKPGDDVSA